VRSSPSVCSSFAAVAARFSGAPALVCDGARITCADLDALSTRISAQLRRAGLRESQIVGLVARRSIEATAAILGICRRGLPATGYLLPPKLLRYICRDSDLAHRWARGLAQAIVTLASRPARREDFPPRIMPALPSRRQCEEKLLSTMSEIPASTWGNA